MTHADFGSEAVLGAQNWLFLLLIISAVFGSWWKTPFPTYPYGVSQWAWRIIWFLLNSGLVVAIFSYAYASTHPLHGKGLGYFSIDTKAENDWTWLLIIVHLVHVHANEAYSAARFNTVGYWVSTVLFCLTILAGAACSALTFHQHVWGAGIGYACYTLAQLIILVAFVVAYDRKSRNALREMRNKARGYTVDKSEGGYDKRS